MSRATSSVQRSAKAAKRSASRARRGDALRALAERRTPNAEPNVIAIDGPAGAGKTTIARAIARRLGWLHVDTGAMYRALTWVALRRRCDPDDPAALYAVARRTRLRLTPSGRGTLHVFINGRDVTRPIRQPRINRWVSQVARHPRIRRWMVHHQRALARRGPVVMEGRDIGTVVFPRARWKFFLSASPHERARRRHAELLQKGVRLNRTQVLRELAARDTLDRHRTVGPLKAAPDAVRLDTTRLSIPQVIERILRRIAC